MTNMQEAYEALVEKLRAEISRMDERLGQENAAISHLLDYIYFTDGEENVRAVAKQAEEKGARDLTSYVEDLIGRGEE